MSVLTEKHNRELVPHCLALASPITNSSSITKLPKQKLAVWLVLFSKFIISKALHSSSTSHHLSINPLSHPDRSLQSTALTQYEHYICALLDDTRWKDELALLDLGLDWPNRRAENGLEITRERRY